MGCCGQRRAELKSRLEPVPARPPIVVNARPTAVIAPRPDAGGSPQRVADTHVATVVLRYLANSALRVNGAVTSRTYEFSAGQPVQAVAAIDAPALMASRLFRRA